MGRKSKNLRLKSIFTKKSRSLRSRKLRGGFDGGYYLWPSNDELKQAQEKVLQNESTRETLETLRDSTNPALKQAFEGIVRQQAAYDFGPQAARRAAKEKLNETLSAISAPITGLYKETKKRYTDASESVTKTYKDASDAYTKRNDIAGTKYFCEAPFKAAELMSPYGNATLHQQDLYNIMRAAVSKAGCNDANLVKNGKLEGPRPTFMSTIRPTSAPSPARRAPSPARRAPSPARRAPSPTSEPGETIY